MDSSELFSHPIVHDAVRRDDTSSDPVAAPVFSDADTTSSQQRHR